MVKWTVMKTMLQNNEKKMERKGRSIYSAQATELKEAKDEERLLFQMDGLHDWRDVAHRVLSSVGWQESCTYTDSISPSNEENNKIRWEKIEIEATEPEQGDAKQQTDKPSGQNVLEIHSG